MKIGEVAHRSGVSIEAIRFYERRGVLPPAQRTPSGYRVFGQDALPRLDLVRRLQELGFTLDEIVDALEAHDDGAADCGSQRWRLERVSERIGDKIEQLQVTQRLIRATLRDCEQGQCRLSSP